MVYSSPLSRGTSHCNRPCYQLTTNTPPHQASQTQRTRERTLDDDSPCFRFIALHLTLGFDTYFSNSDIWCGDSIYRNSLLTTLCLGIRRWLSFCIALHWSPSFLDVHLNDLIIITLCTPSCIIGTGTHRRRITDASSHKPCAETESLSTCYSATSPNRTAPLTRSNTSALLSHHQTYSFTLSIPSNHPSIP